MCRWKTSPGLYGMGPKRGRHVARGGQNRGSGASEALAGGENTKNSRRDDIADEEVANGKPKSFGMLLLRGECEPAAARSLACGHGPHKSPGASCIAGSSNGLRCDGSSRAPFVFRHGAVGRCRRAEGGEPLENVPMHWPNRWPRVRRRRSERSFFADFYRV